MAIAVRDQFCPRHSKRITGSVCTCVRRCNFCGGEYRGGDEHETWECVRTLKTKFGPPKGLNGDWK